MTKVFLLNALAGLALAASGALAQELPVFDDAKGFEIIGVADDVLIIRNSGAYFACEVREYEDQLRIGAPGCRPIVGDSNSSVPYEARLETARSMLESMPMPVVLVNIAAVMQDEGCVLDISSEDAMEDELIRLVGLKMGIDSDLIPALRDPLFDLLDDGFDVMMDQGRVYVNESLGRVLLTDCG